jgi:beta-galactosidase
MSTMKGYLFILTHIFLQAVSVAAFSQGERQARQRLLMDYNWKFIQSDVKGAEGPDFNDSPWRTLNLPHDWSIEGEFKQDAPTKGNGGYLPTGVGWYRKHFKIPSIRNAQNFWIEFDGVYMNSDVWINGHELGIHPYGYTSFYYDITRYLKKGDNIIAVRVDNSVQPNSRWYSGSGIYRHVWLHTAGPVHIAQWGTYVTTPSSDSTTSTVVVRTSIENTLATPKNIVLRSTVKDKFGKEIETIETKVSLPPSVKTEIEQKIPVTVPSLWSIEKPTLYSLHSSIVEGTKISDNLITPFGIRKIEYDKDKGFFLNGKHVKMNGVCLHHDGGGVGAAVPEQVWVRRLELLKEMGCNAIRTAHNPPAAEFLDLCDKMGFVVMDEAFDEWEEMKGQVNKSYHLHFKEWWKRDLLSMIYRDRNHPSIVMWSAGNEVPDQVVDRGQQVLKDLLEVLHTEDPTRPVTVANDRIASGDDSGPAKIPFLNMQDIVGHNYVDRWGARRELYYSVDRHEHPEWKMVGTEHTAVRGVRGKYFLPPVKPGTPDYRTGMMSAEQLWKFTAVNDYVIGDFMWAGIDFLGEANWPNKNSASGVIDLSGFPKDGYYFYQSQWTKKPMVHVLPHWNWAGNEGKIVPVIAYTNCDTVELFVNNKSFGKKSYVFPQQGHTRIWNTYDKAFINPTTSDLHVSWDVPYESGTLKVVGVKNGKVVTEEVRTTSRATAVRLSADRHELMADSWDVANVRVEIIDENGLVVPDANNLIEFKVEGAGILLAADNGNPEDKSSMKSKQKQTFNGLALAIIQSTEKTGVIRVTAVSANLKSGELQITSVKPTGAAVRVESLK